MTTAYAPQGNWNMLRWKLKQTYAQLTDRDLQFIEGHEDEFIGRLQKRAGATREEIERLIRSADSEL